MADVSHTSVGYTGTVDQVAEAQRLAAQSGVPFKAVSATDWAVTAYASANRTVQIAAGSAVCCGVRDVTAAAATLTVAANTSGSTRLDVLVATFNWAAGTPVTTFAVIQGTTSLPTVNTGGSVVSGQINRIPGVQYDAVLAVISVPNNAGVLSSSNVLDRRLYGSDPLAIADTASYLTMVDVGGAGRVRSTSSGAEWLFVAGSWTRLPKTDQVFSSLATRDSYFSGLGGKVKGDHCVCTGPGGGPCQMTYDGTKWRFNAAGLWTGTTDANGFFNIPHGGGQAPFGWTMTPGYQPDTGSGTDANNLYVKLLSSSNAGDSTVLGGRAIWLQNFTYYVSGSSITVAWTAQF